MEKQLRVLHVTPDDKFFDSVFMGWEKNENFTNEAVCITVFQKHELKFIKSVEKIEVLRNLNMFKERLKANNYDILFFHSIPSELYKFFKYIPQDKIVIWWMWGYDIYDQVRGLPPYIKLDLYKPLTKAYLQSVNNRLTVKLYKLYLFLIKNIMQKQRLEMLRRIDFFQPVLKTEYEMMCADENFKASEFYSKARVVKSVKPQPKHANGNILLGNSATATNNHLDVLEVVKRIRSERQQIIMPLNYGDKKYVQWLGKHLDYPYITAIYDYMPRDEYFRMLDDCSYAVIGSIRQQAMGNINYAIRHGIKVFLYKDSMAYKNLINLGYVVFAIEDMDENSLKTPLTKEQMLQNDVACQNEYNRRMAVYNDCIKEMWETLSNIQNVYK